MTHKAKKCAHCGAENPPEEVLCRKCQVMLPSHVVDVPDPDRSQTIRLDLAPETRTGPRGQKRLELPPEAFKPIKPEFRKWPYEAVPIQTPHQPWRVVVVDFDISFWHLVMLMVKTAFAAIPALVITFILFMGIVLMFGPMFGIGR